MKSPSIVLLLVVLSAALAPAQAQDDSRPPLTRVGHDELHTIIEKNGASVTVVNFWATWCVPCREEFPYFVGLGREFEGKVDVLFVSMDFDDQYEAARSFLKEQDVQTESFFKQGKDDAFINAFSEEWSGAIPATFFYAPGGRLVSFWEGKISHDELQRQVRRALDDIKSLPNR